MWFKLVSCNNDCIEVLTFACLLCWVSGVVCLPVEEQLFYSDAGGVVLLHKVIGHPHLKGVPFLVSHAISCKSCVELLPDHIADALQI